jgi:hypothetical protein
VQDVPGGDQDGVADGHDGAFHSPVRDQSPELGAEVSALGPGGGESGEVARVWRLRN